MNFVGCVWVSTPTTTMLHIILKGVPAWGLVSFWKLTNTLAEDVERIENGGCCIKCLWYTLSVFLAILAFFGNFLFFALFGLSYELIKCYIEKPKLSEEEERENRRKDPATLEEEKRQLAEIFDDRGIRIKTNQVIVICVFIAIGGWFLQPLYVLFYLTYGLLEFYRRVKWIFFYSQMGGGVG